MLPPAYWYTQSYFRKFESYAQTLIVVNNHAERSVCRMQQFVNRYTKEEEKQERLITVDRVRYAMKDPGRNSTKKSKREMQKSLESVRDVKKNVIRTYAGNKLFVFLINF